MTEKHVAWTDLGEYIVSTVNLGMAPLGETGYETMVFPARDGKVTDWGELDVERYSTHDEAAAGHAAMLEKWSK